MRLWGFCWALWAMASPGSPLTGEQILGSLLQQLHLSEVPILDQADVEQLVTPAHVRAQYVALLRDSHQAHSRGKRFSQHFRGEVALPQVLGWVNWACPSVGVSRDQGGPGWAPVSSGQRLPPLQSEAAGLAWTHCPCQHI